LCCARHNIQSCQGLLHLSIDSIHIPFYATQVSEDSLQNKNAESFAEKCLKVALFDGWGRVVTASCPCHCLALSSPTISHVVDQSKDIYRARLCQQQ
jgi:hypothetical protein